MQRTPLLAGNWKMFPTLAEASELAHGIAAKPVPNGREVMIAPPAPCLHGVGTILADTDIILASQNICWEEKGAFTGEISPTMLKEAGGTMAIIGHSERRQIFKETDTMVNTRLLGALKHGITPVLCIGETLTEREKEQTMDILKGQLINGLKEVSHESGSKIIVAYEPVWAIGTGKTASSAQAQEAHAFVRTVLADIFDKTVAEQIRVLYGGSVNPTTVDELMSQPDVDGALVGGAALQVDSFLRIINFEA
jgi:triosephosphate isomerase